ncbi:MAG: hypothetical protein AB8D52_12810 [Gammaproteobacteria bacterium]
MKIFFASTLIFLLVGCSSAVKRHEQVKMDLDRPVNCETAPVDISMLEKEKVGTVEKLSNGIVSIFPTSAVYNLLTGEYSSRYSIATGEYNDMLDFKINQIQKQCML